jgi:hypothetical protein
MAARTRSIASEKAAADAERVRRLAGRHEEVLHLGGIGAELRSETQLRMIGRDADSDTKIEVRSRAGHPDDLLQLFHRVEREGADIVLEISLGNRFLGLDRMHEADRRFRQRLGDKPHLGDRGHVVMRDSAIPKDLEEIGRRIRLHRIEHPARKLLYKEAGGAPGGVRTKERDRLDRSKGRS